MWTPSTRAIRPHVKEYSPAPGVSGVRFCRIELERFWEQHKSRVAGESGNGDPTWENDSREASQSSETASASDGRSKSRGSKQTISLRTKTASVREAERIWQAELERRRRPTQPTEKTFVEAAKKYADTQEHLANYADNLIVLAEVVEHIGDLPLARVHDGTLDTVNLAWHARALKPKSINNYIGLVSRVLHLAAQSWRDAQGYPWLRQAPPVLTRIPLRVVESEAGKPYPLEWDEQRRLFAAMPRWLADWSLFAVNTGCREQEVCRLRWTDDKGDDVWVRQTKNGKQRAIVLNSIARRVVKDRPRDSEYVFTRPQGHLDGVKLTAMKHWRDAWRVAGLPTDRRWKRGVHNLRHTFGHRLEAAGLDEDTVGMLIGHSKRKVTQRYTAPELERIRSYVELVVEPTSGRVLRAV